MLALQAENRVAVNDCVATGFNLWDYEGILDHRPRKNTKQCGNRFSDEKPDVIFVAVTDLMARSRILISAD